MGKRAVGKGVLRGTPAAKQATKQAGVRASGAAARAEEAGRCYRQVCEAAGVILGISSCIGQQAV